MKAYDELCQELAIRYDCSPDLVKEIFSMVVAAEQRLRDEATLTVTHGIDPIAIVRGFDRSG